MKSLLLFLFIFSFVIVSLGQSENSIDLVRITSEKGKIRVITNTNGELLINVSPKDIDKFKTIGHVRYSDFGAKGDGKTDDLNAIVATHAFANQEGLKVKATAGANYYIGGKDLTAEIETDTDFGTATFIFDDRNLEKITTPVFRVKSNLPRFAPEGIQSLRRNQQKLPIELDQPCLILVENDHVYHYKRMGLNVNDGYPQSDIFMVDKQGIVDPRTPIIWDFDEITKIEAIPIDEKTLKITGGKFLTIANQAESKYNYHGRNIEIERSNVIIDGVEHRVKGEGETGAPYRGFISIKYCYNVKVINAKLSGHKTYKTIGRAELPVSMGSYDINLNHAISTTFQNCRQINDIRDNSLWGIMGTNYCKNIVLDSCTFSRFDAHMGVTNATVRNCEIGYMGIKAIGHGTFKIENTTVYANHFLTFRQDYGSTWRGDFIIKNCVFVPTSNNPSSIHIINGFNSGQHDFGYTCYMPETFTIENFLIRDGDMGEDYQGPILFSDFNPEMTDESYLETYPYVLPREMNIKNMKISSGKPLKVSPNEFMFKDVDVIIE